MIRKGIIGAIGGLCLWLGAIPALRADAEGALVKGYTLTEIGSHLYDASTDPGTKTEAQQIIDRLYDLGVRHVNLSPRAKMTNPRGNELVPFTPLADRSAERERYRRLIAYAHGKGMTVGLRPIFFVVDANGNVPFVETLPNGTRKTWWHGNIQPSNPNAWFESFKTYMDIYLPIARFNKVEEFTIGAELYSMTVGIEDQWTAYPYGFPGRWLELLRYARSKLAPGTRVMYDVNFTDDKAVGPSASEFGGEFARWRYRIVDLANPTDPNERKIWEDLVAFWKELDAVGIDMYRSLAPAGVTLPLKEYGPLTAALKQTTDRYASQIDNALYEIQSVVGVARPVIFKELGFRSVDKGFIDPGTFAGGGTPNAMHQAAAYRAVLETFWKSSFSWFKGIIFWDASVSPQLHGPNDVGFSPLGKSQTEAVVKEYFGH